ncbi:MAG TPA: NAD-dependent epimerase/dehydratase family protein, partial [Burkholderiales bacterium]|nr:NAD-dependent epimerase/dehydratase family protein [Burkholderiales bacterium]
RPLHAKLANGVQYVDTGDLAGYADWPRILEGAVALVHLAGIAHRAERDERRLDEVNVRTAEKAARAAASAKARFLFVSSAKVHGDETATRPFRAQDDFAPRDAYSRTKVAAERAIGSIPGLGLTVLRPPLVYGPCVKANFLALMTAIGRGFPLPLSSVRNRRSLLYVGNLAHAVVRCLETPTSVGGTYMIADGPPVSTPQLCRALGKALGRPAHLFPFPVPVLELHAGMRRLTRSLELDDSAIRSELGWHPPYTFEEGLRLTAEWYLAQRG